MSLAITNVYKIDMDDVNDLAQHLSRLPKDCVVFHYSSNYFMERFKYPEISFCTSRTSQKVLASIIGGWYLEFFAARKTLVDIKTIVSKSTLFPNL